MSGGTYRRAHEAWCPALSNPRPQPKRIAKGVVVEWTDPPQPFDCLCNYGRIQLADPRPEVVEAAVARYRERYREPVEEARPQPESLGFLERVVKRLKTWVKP